MVLPKNIKFMLEELKAQVLETRAINHRTNLLLLDHLDEESLTYSTNARGGGSVGHQLAHLYNIRFWRMERINKAIVADYSTIKAKDPKTIEFLWERHTASYGWIAEALAQALEHGTQLKSFKRGVVPFLGYIINHEAHHRGNILLTLKRSGFSLPNALKYGIWEWNRL